MRLRTHAAVALAALAALGGCSLGDDPDQRPPQLGTSSDDEQGASKLGFPSTATRNTIRVGGGDAAADAAGVASAIFPGTSEATRPTAVVLVDKDDWQAGVTAAALAANPIGAPLLLSDGGELGAVTSDTLKRLKPKGSDLSRDAQVIRIGSTPPRPEGFKTAVIEGRDPYTRAAAIDRFFSAAKGKPSPNVVIASGEQAAYAMPAAAWAARSGDTVLLTRRNSLPAATRRALRGARQAQHLRARARSGRSRRRSSATLRRLGRVRRIQGANPVANSIAFARYESGDFGWGVVVPGYNFTLANTSRPLDAAASAILATKGVFAPLAAHRPGGRPAQAAGGLPAERAARVRGRPGTGGLQPRVDPRRRRPGLGRGPGPPGPAHRADPRSVQRAIALAPPPSPAVADNLSA